MDSTDRYYFQCGLWNEVVASRKSDYCGNHERNLMCRHYAEA